MIENLDGEMRARGIDGIFGYGETTLADPDLIYAAGGMLPRGGLYFKRVGRSPLLIVSNVDYGSAKRLGRVKRIETLTQWGYEALLRKHPERYDAYGRLIASVLQEEGVHGKVVLFGRNDLAKGLQFAHTLSRLGVPLVGERPPTVLESARDTKDKTEVEKIKGVGDKTARVVNEILQSLRNAKEKRGHLEVGNKRATVGLIKSMIASKLAREGLVAPEGTIFAIGPSGADPHNPGIPTAEIRKGRLIVFDIFPQAENGYWFDLTRTFLVGRADSKARKLFETVQQAQSDALDYLRAGLTGEAVMSRVCDEIERRGFRTVRRVFEVKARSVGSGFTHSLGHGVGLTIGETPYLGFNSRDPLKPGEVVTVEPGVYMPGYGGVRIEDTVLIKSKSIENLAHVEKELELT
jgi:Xaa-Pro aminopeptidase